MAQPQPISAPSMKKNRLPITMSFRRSAATAGISWQGVRFRGAYQEIATPSARNDSCSRWQVLLFGPGIGPTWAAFIKNLVYFLCKVCYNTSSVRRDGLTRAKNKEKYAICCGQKDHLPDDSGSKGMALAALDFCAFYTGALI